MKVYKVKVNGKVYEVEVESVSEVAGTIQTPVQQTPVQVTPVQATPVQAGDQNVPAPMAGTILDIKVSVGQQVKENDVLCILEAMKLENEVVSPCAGTVKSIAVSKGATVSTGQLLIVIG